MKILRSIFDFFIFFMISFCVCLFLVRGIFDESSRGKNFKKKKNQKYYSMHRMGKTHRKKMIRSAVVKKPIRQKRIQKRKSLPEQEKKTSSKSIMTYIRDFNNPIPEEHRLSAVAVVTGISTETSMDVIPRKHVYFRFCDLNLNLIDATEKVPIRSISAFKKGRYVEIAYDQRNPKNCMLIQNDNAIKTLPETIVEIFGGFRPYMTPDIIDHD